MAFPKFIDEVAFASLPFDQPQVWTDLSSRTRLRSFSRGRQTEDAAPSTGLSSLTFENSDRALDPVNAASTYYPNVLPMRRSRCRATFDNITFYPIFSTFIDPEQGWQLNQLGPAQSEAVAPANDGFDILSTYNLTAAQTYPQQNAGPRIGAILDTVGWPAAERSIDPDPSSSAIQAAGAGSLTNVTALDAIMAAAANDNGVFYIDAQGYAVFKGRHRQTDTRYTTSQATFADKANWSAGRVLYTSLPPVSSKILNDYRVTRQGGTEQPWENATSISAYGRRTKAVSTLHVTDADALNYAQYRVLLDKDPYRRYDELTVEPLGDSAVWLILLTLQIGDRITVMQSPPGGGAADVRDMIIEAVSATVGPGPRSEWKFRLSPVSSLIGWVIGDAIYGLLGQTTVITY